MNGLSMIRKKMHGAVLVYVVMMSLVVFLLLGIILLRHRLEYVRLHLVVEQDWIRDQVNSAALLLGACDSLLNRSNHILPGVPVRFERYSEAWGLLHLEMIVSETHRITDTAVFLCGTGYVSEDSTALYFPDEGYYLSVAGDTELRGICYAPLLGIRKGYVQGEGYYKDSVVYGTIRPSEARLPELHFSLYAALDKTVRTDEIRELPSGAERLFQEPVLTFYSAFPISLSNCRFEGKIRIVSGRQIEVDSTCSLQHCILVAPVIKIGKGFSGKVQLFASEKIGIDAGVSLLYPSVIWLYSERAALLEIWRGATVSGAVLLTGNPDALCLMQPEATIYGQLYNEGVTQLHGKVYGPAYLRKLRFHNERGKYENIIRDGIIDNSCPEKNRGSLNLFSSPKCKPVMARIRGSRNKG